MKKIFVFRFLVLMNFVFIFNQCSKDNISNSASSDAKEITSFVFKFSSNPSLDNADITATITGENITAELPLNTPVTSLKPNIKHSGAGISIANEGATDFTNPVKITVTAINGSKKNYTVTVTVRQTPDIFTGVYIRNTTGIGGVYTVWKDAKDQIYSLNPGDVNIIDMAIMGSDIYFCGDKHPATSSIAEIWKNGTEVFLGSTVPSKISHAMGMKIIDSDVFVYGSESNNNVLVARYWKNNIAQSLNLENETRESRANDIVIKNSDIYVCGYDINPNNVVVAKYWKNGLETILTNGLRYGYASGIAVTGSDVYVSGTEKNVNGVFVAKYWKNGISQSLSLTNTNKDSYADGLVISGTDVIVYGFEFDSNNQIIGKIWKNGTQIFTGDSNKSYFFNKIAVFGSDIYFAGREEIFFSSNPIGKIWRYNGTTVSNVFADNTNIPINFAISVKR